MSDAARAEFAKYDADGNGVLTAAEIRQVNDALGDQGVSREEIEAFIKSADSDGDGGIGLEEFAALFGGGKHERR